MVRQPLLRVDSLWGAGGLGTIRITAQHLSLPPAEAPEQELGGEEAAAQESDGVTRALASSQPTIQPQCAGSARGKVQNGGIEL